MGLNNENARRVVFDIETAPLPEAADFLEPAEAPGNYKDQEKIAAYIAAENAKQLDRCALDLDLCRVVSVGLIREGVGDVQIAYADTDSEPEILHWFWSFAWEPHLVGFNCVAFDLPVLLRRSLYLGVKVPDISLDRYRHPRVSDLQQILSYNGALKLRGLSFYAKRFGLGHEDEITGADIAQCVAKGDWASVRSHVTKDVRKTALLANKLGLFSLDGFEATEAA